MTTPQSKIFLLGLALATSVTAYGQAPKGAPAPEAKPAPVRSVFTTPTRSNEGRDPFFPESGRVYQSMAAESASHTVEISSLTVKGYYRDSKTAYVIINNRTFAVGDECDVLTPGGRVHIHCLEIGTAAVVIDINGSRHELLLNPPK